MYTISYSVTVTCVAYIGETGRSLPKKKNRIAEHKYAVKTNNRKSSIAVHVWDNDHQSDLIGMLQN